MGAICHNKVMAPGCLSPTVHIRIFGMDLFHRDIPPDSRTARTCQFCKKFDPDFSHRHSRDQFVEEEDTAKAHITEDGHVRHRLVELSRRLQGSDTTVASAA